MAASDQASGVVLGQTVVESKSNEVTAFAPLLDRLDLDGVLVTADALHTHRGHAEYLHSWGGHYLWIVKANQPRQHTQILALPWAQIPVIDTHNDRGHGRVETRRVKLTAVGAGTGVSTRPPGHPSPATPPPIGSRTWSSATV